MLLSVVIPAYNEEGSIAETITSIYAKLKSEDIAHEIFVVNDNSKDSTESVLKALQASIPTLRYETNLGPNGFGYAVR
jgi:dolichol-phosphate mannosyltransferase